MLKALAFWAIGGGLVVTACLLTDPLDEPRSNRTDVRPDSGPDSTDDSGLDLDADTEIDPTADAETPCGRCLDSNCSNELTVCGNNLDCVALLSCLSDCDASDDSCQQACADTYADGIDNLLDVLDCTEANCSADCS